MTHRADEFRQLDPMLLRHMVALAHSVPGVTLELEGTDGARLIVAHHRLDAHLDPCQLRRLVVLEGDHRTQQLLRTIRGVRIVAGLADIGAGLHRRPGTVEQRWFATSLTHQQLEATLADCPMGLPDGAMNVVAHPDPELGVTAVSVVTNHPSFDRQLDSVATWALASVMTAELIVATQPGTCHPGTATERSSQGWRDGV
jgi:hypothetical protein